MLLEPKELELFFRLHRTLMWFVNQRLCLTPEKITTPEEFAALGIPKGFDSVHSGGSAIGYFLTDCSIAHAKLLSTGRRRDTVV